MTRPLRLLGGAFNPPSLFPEPDDEPSSNMGSDSALILLALFCALVCVLGLVVVARCVWLRRLATAATPPPPPPPPPTPPPNKGLKKKILRSLPKLTYTADSTSKFTECAICLTEFAPGDEIRELPQCGHRFHVACIDVWLRSHSSCPSCRQIPEVSNKCHKCGGFSSLT
ncbi:RING-H2 finger protein ATL80 [Prunus yedoensis var. nudiflora]|uniref:RING-H2 finger protein ATL80 n=1 Tax=Prunus yedoensis var. nudiflora TaxID=2094558 RepID=A0A314Z0Z1_PRUYE|nr:RING-H2 finger protein ATL80 [Prunus yedoensis var. nudiflora]